MNAITFVSVFDSLIPIPCGRVVACLQRRLASAHGVRRGLKRLSGSEGARLPSLGEAGMEVHENSDVVSRLR